MLVECDYEMFIKSLSTQPYCLISKVYTQIRGRKIKIRGILQIVRMFGMLPDSIGTNKKVIV